MKRNEALDHVKKLTMDDRNRTHGDPVAQFERAQRIKAAVGHQLNPDLTPGEREAIESICTKLSRWMSGKRAETTTEKWAEHPLDIIGYASIAVEAIYASEPAATMSDRVAGVRRAEVVELDPPKATPPSDFAAPGSIAKRFAPPPRKEEAS